MKNIVLFGPPGSGKGTQSELLVHRLGMLQISTGDLLRSEIRNKTEVGIKAKTFIDKGELVPDIVVLEIVKKALSTVNNRGLILDGFPRNTAQAEALWSILDSIDMEISCALFLEVPKSLLIERLSGRRVCSECGSVFHISTKPTVIEGVCDNCQGRVIQRPDDKIEVIGTRLKTYEDSTSPLKEYFRKKGIYFEVEGTGTSEEVYNKLKQYLT